MNLVGKKVILRVVEEADLELLRESLNDPDIESKTVGWNLPISKKDQIEWFQKEKNSLKSIRYIIISKSNNMAVGMLGLHNIDWKNGTVAAIGIKIFKTNDKHKGVAYDAFMTLLKYAFYELRLNRIEYNALSDNVTSINLVKKVGYKIESKKRNAVLKNGRFVDVVIGRCLKSDYEEKLQETHYWDEDFSEPSNPLIKKQCIYCMHMQEGNISIKFLEHIIKTCDCAFKIPILNRVNLNDFFNKLSKNAIIIYASQIDILAYVAFYANDKNSKEAYISLIAVKPEIQNYGIGKKLLNECICISCRYGMNKIALKVDKDNANAIKFYLKNGFNLKNEDNKQYLMEKYIG